MDEGRIRKIIHIDMDAFYASVEQREVARVLPSSIAKLFRAANAATSTLVVQKSHLVWPIEST